MQDELVKTLEALMPRLQEDHPYFADTDVVFDRFYAAMLLLIGTTLAVVAITLFFVADWGRGNRIGWFWFDRLRFYWLGRTGRIISGAVAIALATVAVIQGVSLLVR